MATLSSLVGANKTPWKVTALPDPVQLSSGYPTIYPSVEIASGTAAQQLLNISGSGILRLAYIGGSTTTRDVTVTLTVDGETLIDNKTESSVSTGEVVQIVGRFIITASSHAFLDAWEIPFRSSLTLTVTNSVSASNSDLYYHIIYAEPYEV